MGMLFCLVLSDIMHIQSITPKPGRRIRAEKAWSSLCIPQQSMVYISPYNSNVVLILFLFL